MLIRVRGTSHIRNARNNRKSTSSIAAINSNYASSSRYAERARTPTATVSSFNVRLSYEDG
jgi:translation elongation factor P/translation initiation factor 5A